MHILIPVPLCPSSPPNTHAIMSRPLPRSARTLHAPRYASQRSHQLTAPLSPRARCATPSIVWNTDGEPHSQPHRHRADHLSRQGSTRSVPRTLRSATSTYVDPCPTVGARVPTPPPGSLESRPVSCFASCTQFGVWDARLEAGRIGESKELELTERRALQITSGDDCLAIKGVSGSAGLG